MKKGEERIGCKMLEELEEKSKRKRVSHPETRKLLRVPV